MAEWIDDTAQAPPIGFRHRDDLPGACRNRPGKHAVRIRHGQDHPDGTTAQRLRTEVAMLRGLISQSKLCAIHGQPTHDRTTRILETKDFSRPECQFVELNRSRAIPNGQHGRDRTGSPSASVCAHLSSI